MATPAPASTDTRVERLVVVGGSIAIPPAPMGTAATVIGTGPSPPGNSTTELSNVTNKFPLESKAKSLTCLGCAGVRGDGTDNARGAYLKNAVGSMGLLLGEGAKVVDHIPAVGRR